MIASCNQAGSAGPKSAFLGHPRGLAYIAFTEAWERFSFYGMQALLVLYMAGYLLQPGKVEGVLAFSGFRAGIEWVFGPLTTQALATQIFGLYIGLVYLTPSLGGLVGDRVLGRHRAVLSGAVMMAVGHFLMAFEAAFLFALLVLIMGSGLLKGNLAAQVGGLYDRNDQRRDAAFIIYNMAINVGAFVAPLVCGTLGELYGWHYGFGAAGIGMLVGISIYVAGQNHLPPDLITEKTNGPRLQPGDGHVIIALLIVFVIAALFWTAQSQVWNTYPLWVRGRVDRDLLDFIIPVTWFQSIDTLAVLVLAPFILWLWKQQSQRGAEPEDLGKIAIGCAVFAGGCLWLSAAEIVSGVDKIDLLWPVVFHFVSAVGFLYVGPIMLALVSRAAPVAVNAMMVGAYYLSIFAGGIVSGWLGRFYEVLPASGFWLMHACIAASGSILVLLIRRPLERALNLDRSESMPEAGESIATSGA